MRALARRATLLAFAGALATSAAPAWSRAPEPALRRFALLASANDGGFDRVPLRFAHSDAAGVADVLRKLGGLSDDDTILLTGARRASFRAAFERIRAAIARAGAEAPARRELIVYYSGHSDEEGLLLGGERVSYRELRQWLDGAGAEVRIAILDSCASGALIRLRGGTLRPSFLHDTSSSARGHAFLTSSSAHESAQESDRIGAAFFTHYLLSGLRGAADTSRDGLVTLAEAYQFAFHETLGRTERSAAGPQHPAYDIQLAGTGDLVLTDVRATGAHLVIDEKVAGRLYVRDGAGRLLVELRKEPVYPVQLGLGPGRYRVTIDADGRTFEANVTLEQGKITRLGQAQLERVARSMVAVRGDGGPPTTVAGLVTTGPTTLGAYGGINMRYGRLDGRDSLFAGGEGALVINHRYIVGISAMGGSVPSQVVPGESVGMGFAALVLRYRLVFDGSPFDFTAGLLAGPGGIGTPGPNDQRAIFVFEPQLTAGVNLARWARLGADFGHRWVAGDYVTTDGLHGWTAGAYVQFGWF